MTTLNITRNNDSPYLPVASTETTMHNQIEAVVNGSLDKTNFKPTVAVPVTSLVGLSPRKGKVVCLRVFDQNTGFAAFGYEETRFVYDDALGKWVSAPVLWFHQHSNLTVTTGQGYTDLPHNAQINQSWLRHALSWYDAGVRPQVWMGAEMVAGASGTVKARIRAVENTGEIFFSTLFLSNELTHNTTTGTFKILDWHTMNFQGVPPATGKAYSMIFVVDCGVTVASGTIKGLSAYVRLVSA